MSPKSIISRLVLASVALSLAGCISVFPKSKPVQMYRFGISEAASTTTPTGVAVARVPTAFTRPAAGDRMLTSNGQETAYIAEARWISPAVLMFDDAVEQAFDHRASGPRFVTRGDLATAEIGLRLDVDTFEARYLDGPKAAPTIVVSMRATLVRLRDHAVLGEKVFASTKPASDNRVGDIAASYDAAVKESVAAMTDWVSATVGG